MKLFFFQCACVALLWTASPVVYAVTTPTVQLRADVDLTSDPLKGAAYLQSVVAELPEPNASIIRMVLEYPTDGTHTYWWPRAGEGSYDGSTTDVLVNGALAMKGESEQRTFCCGLTLEVYYRYLNGRPDLREKLSQDQYSEFKKDWFCREIFSPGPEDALRNFKLGVKITDLNAARPGDFVQLWRNNKSGHSVIFVNWIADAHGNKLGFRYWSTQKSSNGIGYQSEYFGDEPRAVDEKHLSIARAAY